ncbi:hypothetical protein SAMN02745181_3872 [Rubritalea squalenifaciens DSM 18772]|uniref:Type II secretory pathway, pseudopilin PulG n=1 Tax=Rubritalea squalenifaciens DSM 18772 TaxID=1123071 RepID=A0A1M6SR89_9BACT|nr:hypothetical protein [Rubritalea squalenifaciens]SHK47264.1 hypothetical protein SAMN02745181_3872 [Rubritalea squalenifaciens DSM 18772]
MDKGKQSNGSVIATAIVLIAVAGLAGYFLYFSVIPNSTHRPYRTEAISYIRQVIMALNSYAVDHDGQMPTGDSVEQCFSQLIEQKYIDDERYFWNQRNAESLWNASKPPNNNGELTPGECSFGYVSGLNFNHSPADTPLIFDAAVSPGQFSTAVWDGRALVGRLNHAVVAMEITAQSPTEQTSATPQQGAIFEQRGEHNINIFIDLIPKEASILIPSSP